MPRELSLSTDVPGGKVACDTSCPRIVNTLTCTVFWVRIVMVPLRWKISTPSVALGSVRLLPCTSALEDCHCTLAVATLAVAIAIKSINMTKNLLIVLPHQSSKCKNTTNFGNRKKLEGIFSYYCLKIVNNAILNVKSTTFAQFYEP